MDVRRKRKRPALEGKAADDRLDYSLTLKPIINRFWRDTPIDDENPEIVLAAKARLEHLVMSNPGVIFSCRPSQPWETTFVSAGIRSLLGLEPESLLANPTAWLNSVHPDDKQDLLERLAGLPSAVSDTIEYRMKHANGEYVWIRDEMRVDFDAAGTPREFIGYWVDITSYKSLEEQLIFDAFHDPLTKLPNRALFIDRLNVSFARLRRRRSYRFAVFFLDLDRFKSINDRIGHQAGDQLLLSVAFRLLGCVRFGDTVARWSGDEFAIIIDDVKSVKEAKTVAARIQSIFDSPFPLQEQKKFVTGSLGICIARPDYQNPQHLLRDADIAMFQAKRDGRARAVFFREAMREITLNRHKLESDLRHALAKNEIVIHYQPIINAQTAKTAGLEALIRWQHPTEGLVMPGDFIPLAEENGLIIPIGNWVLRQTCFQMRNWLAKYGREHDFGLSINISARQLAGRFTAEVRQILDETGLDPSSLILEITESSVMHDFDRAASIIKQLRRMNIRVFIDDFGTGFSSMNYLHRLPVSGLKIDRSFVAALSPGNEIFEIVKSIIRLAGKLNLSVIAEGVEKQSQLDVLKDLGCQLVQGYLFSRPKSAEETEEFLT